MKTTDFVTKGHNVLFKLFDMYMYILSNIQLYLIDSILSDRLGRQIFEADDFEI